LDHVSGAVEGWSLFVDGASIIGTIHEQGIEPLKIGGQQMYPHSFKITAGY